MSNLFYTYSSTNGTYAESVAAIQNNSTYKYSLVFDEKRGTIWAQDKEYGRGIPVVVSGQAPDSRYAYVINSISVSNANGTNTISYSYINVPSYTYISTNYQTISYVRDAYTYIMDTIEENKRDTNQALESLGTRVTTIEGNYVSYTDLNTYIDSLGYVKHTQLDTVLGSYINNVDASNTGYVIGKIGHVGHNLRYAYVAVPTYEYIHGAYVNNVSLTKSGSGNAVKEVTISKTTTGGVNSYVINVTYADIKSTDTYTYVGLETGANDSGKYVNGVEMIYSGTNPISYTIKVAYSDLPSITFGTNAKNTGEAVTGVTSSGHKLTMSYTYFVTPKYLTDFGYARAVAGGSAPSGSGGAVVISGIGKNGQTVTYSYTRVATLGDIPAVPDIELGGSAATAGQAATGFSVDATNKHKVNVSYSYFVTPKYLEDFGYVTQKFLADNSYINLESLNDYLDESGYITSGDIPEIPEIVVRNDGTANGLNRVSNIYVDSENSHVIHVAYTSDVDVNTYTYIAKGTGTAASGKYVSDINITSSTSGNVITYTIKATYTALPTTPDITISGNTPGAGEAITQLTSSGHTITPTLSYFATPKYLTDFGYVRAVSGGSAPSGSGGAIVISGIDKNGQTITYSYTRVATLSDIQKDTYFAAITYSNDNKGLKLDFKYANTSYSYTYVLPKASTSSYGVVKVGNGNNLVGIDATGKLTYTQPDVSGFITIDDIPDITILEDGTANGLQRVSNIYVDSTNKHTIHIAYASDVDANDNTYTYVKNDTTSRPANSFVTGITVTKTADNPLTYTIKASYSTVPTTDLSVLSYLSSYTYQTSVTGSTSTNGYLLQFKAQTYNVSGTMTSAANSMSALITGANGSSYGLVKSGTSAGQATISNGIISYHDPGDPGDGSLTLTVGGESVTGNNVFTANTSSNGVYDVPVMTASAYGVAKTYFGDIENTVEINGATTTAGKYYGVQKNTDGKLVVNVPWQGGNVTLASSGIGNLVSSVTLDNGVMTISYTESASANTEVLEEAIALLQLEYDNLFGYTATGLGRPVLKDTNGHAYVDLTGFTGDGGSGTFNTVMTYTTYGLAKLGTSDQITINGDDNNTYPVGMDALGRLGVTVGSGSGGGGDTITTFTSNNATTGHIIRLKTDQYTSGYTVTIPPASASTYGLIKATSTGAATTSSIATSGTYYSVQINTKGIAMVRVPTSTSSSGNYVEYTSSTSGGVGPITNISVVSTPGTDTNTLYIVI